MVIVKEIEFLGTWEMIHNPNFKVVEFDHFRMQAGLPSFVMSVSEWIEKTNAIGIIVKKGRYVGASERFGLPTKKLDRASSCQGAKDNRRKTGERRIWMPIM